MPVANAQDKPRLSDELTVVLLRGNGSPRSFRFSLRAFNRTVAALGFTFAFALLACLVLAVMMLVKPSPAPLPSRSAPAAVAVLPVPANTATPAPPALNTAPVPPLAAVPVPPPAKPEVVIAAPSPAPVVAPLEKPAAPAPAAKGGFWSRLTGGAAAKTTASPSTSPAPAVPDSELQKEVEGLRQDVARLGSQLEGRKTVPAGKGEGLLQFFGAGSTLVSENDSGMRIKNPKVGKDGKQITLDFELHNVNPDQRQERGYIVALAKAPDALVSYPSGVFAPAQNIVLDYTKGETFAVSRFRQGRATFPSALLDGKKVAYQVLLFGTDGKVLATLTTGAN